MTPNWCFCLNLSWECNNFNCAFCLSMTKCFFILLLSFSWILHCACLRAKQLYRQDLLYHTNLVARSMGDVSKIGTSRHCTTPGNYSPQTPTRPLKFSRWKTIALPFEPRPFFRGTFVCFFRGALPLIKSLWIFFRYKELMLPEWSSVGRF